MLGVARARRLEVGGAMVRIWVSLSGSETSPTLASPDIAVCLQTISHLGNEWFLALCDVREGAAHYLSHDS